MNGRSNLLTLIKTPGGQLVMQSHPGVLINVSKFERPFIPANCGFGHPLVEETLRQPGVSLHDLRERMASFHGLADLLQLSDSFVEQPHFAKSDTKVVM